MEAFGLSGEDKLSGVTIKDLVTGQESQIPCQGLFVSIGRLPNNDLVKEQLLLDPGGYIVTDEKMQTSQAGVFAIGDVRTTPVRQVVTAVADGAIAVHGAEIYLSGQEN